ncbi:hypothetical protein A5661_22090 [Mycobacterium asiaticum]|nr:hypothetical protein A5661_22090 [Mycobacterium asiaticum]
MLEAAREAVADLVNADPSGVVLGADRAVLLSSLAEASSALRRADGWAPTVLAADRRKAVETVVATESGISMPSGASKCTHPSPSDGCSPRTRATS